MAEKKNAEILDEKKEDKKKNVLEKVKDAIENEIPGDLLSIDLKNVVHCIGEITGEISNDEMLGNIFSNFCIGK